MTAVTIVWVAVSRTGHNVHVDFEPRSGNPDGIGDSGLVIHGKFLRDDMDDLALGRQRDGARGFDDALHILAGDFTRPRGDRRDALAVGTPDMRAGEADKDVLDFDTSPSPRLPRHFS